MLPSRHLLVQNQQWEHRNNAWHMFKIINKATKTLSLLLTLNWFLSNVWLLWSFHRWLFTSKCRLGKVQFLIQSKPRTHTYYLIITVLCNNMQQTLKVYIFGNKYFHEVYEDFLIKFVRLKIIMTPMILPASPFFGGTKATAQKMKFSIRKLRIWSHLLKKSLMENFIFCSVTFRDTFQDTIKLSYDEMLPFMTM